MLLSYRPCEVTRDGVVVPCATLSAAEIERLNDRERSMQVVAADSVQDNVPPSYAVYMFDPGPQTWLIVAAPPKGFMYTDPVSIEARPEPNATDPTSVDPALAAQNLALIEVRSVYDTDGLNRMAEGMLAAVDLPPGCSVGIPRTPPTDALDTRALVADLVRMKDPADAAYGCSPARFVRATRAVAPPSSTMGLRSAIGETEFEQQQILGYAPIEPDGSFKLQVPADVPLALAVVDAKGRGIQTHLNWIQVRPGERRTCDGCHSPRRGGAINSGDGRQHLAGGAATRPVGPAPLRRNHGRAAHAAGCDAAAPETRHGIQRRLGRHQQARRRRARADRRALQRQCRCDARPGHARAGERPDQLPARTSSRSGAATAAPTPAPAAMPTAPSSTCAAPSPAPAAWCRTKS